MFRYLFIVIALTLFIRPAFCQQAFKGRVLESKTRITIFGVRIQNLTSKASTFTDKAGDFTINAKANDLMVLSSFAYMSDTVLLVDLTSREFFLQPRGEMLKQVNVTQKEIKIPGGLGLGGTPEFHNQPVVYKRDAAGNYKGGIALRLFNNSGEKKRQADAEKERIEEKRSEIDKIFTPKNLAQYLPLKDAELEAFKVLYVPSVATYTAAGFNLVSYLNTCYKEFMKLPPEKRVVQALEKPIDQ
ncbi:hypothetical protein [Mucilaginibacter myungsuensis]|uniref:Carboxypeptidase-like protein n=1 Tax=Mucilaginibacter myungsuensis TaxID=649104 RepID=A0A929PYK3_9SPHI|nr:hypothetical protein [Mucilaginibacter myungsuensis]MBE9664371.1 hypothetical protein [Mucilaginibacter myungsuensis]MDN3597081.1 hypothetical protein [Mucilaginibacter myungsuensis]